MARPTNTPDSDRKAVLKLLEAIRRREQFKVLGFNPLASRALVEEYRVARAFPDTIEGRGEALRGIVDEVMKRLRPGEGLPDNTDIGWRSYLALQQYYFERKSKDVVKNKLWKKPQTVEALNKQLIKARREFLEMFLIWERRGYHPLEELKGHNLAAAEQLFAAMPLDVLSDRASLPRHSYVAFHQYLGFVGRSDVLITLAHQCKMRYKVKRGDVPVVAVVGIGGAGKTQLSNEFVHRYGQYFAGGVFWVTFSDQPDEQTVLASIANSGKYLDLPGFSNYDLPEQAKRVEQVWLEDLPRLLVFDNCELEELLAQWRPRSGGCVVLLTSRRRDWSEMHAVQIISLGSFSRDESIELLRKHRPDLAPTDVDLNNIAELLGDLPLAVHLIGSYLARYKDEETPEQVANALREPNLLDHKALQGVHLSNSRIQSTDYNPHVAKAFELSYRKLSTTNSIDQAARWALRSAAWLASGIDIDRKWLKAAMRKHPTYNWSEYVIADGLRRIEGELGFLEEGERTDCVQLHRLLATFVRDQHESITPQSIITSIVLETARSLREDGQPDRFAVVQSHLRELLANTSKGKVEDLVAISNELGQQSILLDLYNEGIQYYTQSLAMCENMLSEHHELTIETLNLLAVAYIIVDELSKAHPLIERALDVCRQVFGAQHYLTATSLHSFGYFLKQRERYQEARMNYEQALAIRRILSEEHRASMAEMLNNLAILLQKLGEYNAAIEAASEALTIDELVYGPNHLETAFGLNTLGVILSDVERYVEARECYERALAIRERLLDPQHMAIASVLNNLAEVLATLGEEDAAYSLYKRSINIRTLVFGPRHSKLATPLINLGDLCLRRGDYRQARQCFTQALDIDQHVDEPRQGDIATDYYYLGVLCLEEEELDQARAHLEEALRLRESVLPPNHTAIAKTLVQLSRLEVAVGNLTMALQWQECAVTIYEQSEMADSEEAAKVRLQLEKLRSLSAKMSSRL